MQDTAFDVLYKKKIMECELFKYITYQILFLIIYELVSEKIYYKGTKVCEMLNSSAFKKKEKDSEDVNTNYQEETNEYADEIFSVYKNSKMHSEKTPKLTTNS